MDESESPRKVDHKQGKQRTDVRPLQGRFRRCFTNENIEWRDLDEP